jgi:hypothetical protein
MPPPDGLDHASTVLAWLVPIALCLALAASQCGCTGAAGIATMAGAVKTTLDAMRVTQRVLCSPALYPILGDPTEGQPVWVQKDASAASDAAAEGGAP